LVSRELHVTGTVSAKKRTFQKYSSQKSFSPDPDPNRPNLSPKKKENEYGNFHVWRVTVSGVLEASTEN
jgi:hypothetical protein